MFEPVYPFDPQQNKTLATLLGSPIRGRDVEVVKAYERITTSIKVMLNKNYSRKKQQYVEWVWPWQIHKQSLIKELVCQFCSVKLTFSDGEYLITLTVPTTAFQPGTGVNTNALLRVAFRHTNDENTNLTIEANLNIVLTYNAQEYYDKKADEYEEQAKVWFNKK